MKDLGLDPSALARWLHVSPKTIQDAENPHNRTPIRLLERIARALGLDEDRIANANVPSGDSNLAVRLRQLRIDRPGFSPATVLTFAEAAWVISKQILLRSWVEPKRTSIPQLGFEPDSRYGDRKYPAWWFGYRLANTTRDLLGISSSEPILSLKTLVEEKLGIPVIQTRLPRKIAGATISNGIDRGIIVNTVGDNENVWVRRVTIAHELGHLLWDPDPRLNKLRVDLYEDFAQQPLDTKDYVEARANAFAVELLLPQTTVRSTYVDSPDHSMSTRRMMETYGISFTSAKFQIWNAMERAMPLSEIRTNDVEPTPDWKGRESYALDYFKPESVPETRRGYFAGLVVAAQKSGLISSDSAASYLSCEEEEFLSHANLVANLYPIALGDENTEAGSER